MKLIYLLALVVMTTVSNVVSEWIPQCSIWHPMGRIPDETDCTRYYQCIFAIPRLTVCPKIADKQTFFNPILELCLWSETSPCKNPSTDPAPGPGTGTEPAPGTGTEPGTSTGTEPGTSTGTEPAPMKCKSETIPDPPTKPENCETDPCNGPIKGNCKDYIKWTGNTKQTITCGENLFYNVMTGQCDLNACPPCPQTKSPF